MFELVHIPAYDFQQPTLHKTIMLEEVSAPPPPASAPSYSSSYASSSASSYSSEEEQEEEEESVCTSYCSSDEEESEHRPIEASPNKMSSIMRWREDFTWSLKREREDDTDDEPQPTSKRSRSSSSRRSISSEELDMHPCPACDEFFPNEQSLRKHGLENSDRNEACWVAVEYALER